MSLKYLFQIHQSTLATIPIIINPNFTLQFDFTLQITFNIYRVQVIYNNLKIKRKEKNNLLDLFECSVIKYDG